MKETYGEALMALAVCLACEEGLAKIEIQEAQLRQEKAELLARLKVHDPIRKRWQRKRDRMDAQENQPQGVSA